MGKKNKIKKSSQTGKETKISDETRSQVPVMNRNPVSPRYRVSYINTFAKIIHCLDAPRSQGMPVARLCLVSGSGLSQEA